MFDDQPTKPGSGVPSNLPLAEPDDILAGVSEEQTSALPASVPSALEAGVLRPKVDQSIPESPHIIVSPKEVDILEPELRREDPPTSPQFDVKDPVIKRIGIRLIIMSVVILALLGSGGWWLYQKVVIPAEENIPPLIPEPINAPPTDFDEDVIESEVLFGEAADTDADGLDDEYEKSLSTDPLHWDSDGDVLSDGDEVIVWKTDPMNPDTDGDSYVDGTEVKAGFNPLGPGRFLDVTNVSTSSKL